MQKYRRNGSTFTAIYAIRPEIARFRELGGMTVVRYRVIIAPIPNKRPPMYLNDLFTNRDLVISIEVFPPKSVDDDAVVHQTLENLRQYDPAFVSCTYGAGGSTQSRTLDLCDDIQSRHGLPVMSHLTCVGATKEQLVEYLTDAASRGVNNIMALRGDAPQGEDTFQAVAGGCRYANELVDLIRSLPSQFGIGVAGYPETHQEAISPEDDLTNLKRKVDAGGDAIFSQLFYVNENFFRFRDQCEAAGITIPNVPGIMPITNFKRIQRITAMCGAIFPKDLSSKLEAVQDDNAAQFAIGVEHAVQQCRELIDAGVPGIHFYALNRSKACAAILDELGLAPVSQ